MRPVKQGRSTGFELPGRRVARRLRARSRADPIGAEPQYDCSVYGDCLLLRGPGRDVTDPSGRHRRGEGSAGAKVGRVHAPR